MHVSVFSEQCDLGLEFSVEFFFKANLDHVSCFCYLQMKKNPKTWRKDVEVLKSSRGKYQMNCLCFLN